MLDIAVQCGLSGFYQEQVGNFIIAENELTVEVMYNITRFLKLTESEWVMGYEDGGDGLYLYLAPIDFLADCHGYTR